MNIATERNNHIIEPPRHPTVLLADCHVLDLAAMRGLAIFYVSLSLLRLLLLHFTVAATIRNPTQSMD